MSVCVMADAATKLRPHIWAGGDDPGIQTTAQEEEEAGEEDEGERLWWISSGSISLSLLKNISHVTVCV